MNIFSKNLTTDFLKNNFERFDTKIKQRYYLLKQSYEWWSEATGETLEILPFNQWFYKHIYENYTNAEGIIKTYNQYKDLI